MENKAKPLSPLLPADEKFSKAMRLLGGKSGILDHIMNSLGDGLSIQDRDMRIVYQNKFMTDNFGSHIGEYCYRIYEKRDEICEGCPIVQAFQTGDTVKALRVGVTKEGDKFRFENIASVLRDEQGEIVAGIEMVHLVEDRERAIDELRESMEHMMQAKAVYENSSDGIMIVDENNCIISVNPAFEAITGYVLNEVAGANPKTLASGRHPKTFFADMWRAIHETGAWRGEIWNMRKDGSVYCQHTKIDTVLDESGKVSNRVCVFSDVTEKKMKEARIEHLAQHDVLTDLPNRTLFVDRLAQAITMAQREGTCPALLYVDLDNFKPVNDTFGHAIGDDLLVLAAGRMRDCLRKSDTVARLGGDEFAIILPRVQSLESTMIVAEKIRKALERPFIIDCQELQVSSSIGCAVYPDNGEDELALLGSADQAMYQAKREGRNRILTAVSQSRTQLSIPSRAANV